MNPEGPRIERDGKVWFVVVPQAHGAPLKFSCDTQKDAEHFLRLFQPSTLRRHARQAS